MASVSTPYTQNKIHAHKLALYIGIGSIVMMFGALTSAYVVRRAQGNWFEFKLPDIFWFNTIVIILSSITLHFSLQAFKKGKENAYKMLLLTTFALAAVFIVLQYEGWVAMDAIGATFTANPSSSFVFVISGLHAAHVLGGMAALTTAMIYAYVLPFKPTPRRRLRFELVTQYWHFVDILWIYLIVFLNMQA
jgi:cytochrome c oxidase subunit 3